MTREQWLLRTIKQRYAAITKEARSIQANYQEEKDYQYTRDVDVLPFFSQSFKVCLNKNSLNIDPLTVTMKEIKKTFYQYDTNPRFFS